MNIEQLKKNWLVDPCWDIENTEGYEAYHDELLKFRLEKEQEWDEKSKALSSSRRIWTIRTELFSNSDRATASQDSLISKLMSEGWQIANISLITYPDDGGDYPVRCVDRYTTLTRELQSAKIDANADLDERIASSK